MHELGSARAGHKQGQGVGQGRPDYALAPALAQRATKFVHLLADHACLPLITLPHCALHSETRWTKGKARVRAGTKALIT